MEGIIKPTSNRSETFKKKSTTIDKRVLRANRRSQEWKQLRQEKVNLNRNLEEMSPVKEEMSFIQRNTANLEIKKPKSRRDALMKWKQEKELLKKLEQEKRRKPVFKVSVTVDSALKKLPKVDSKIPVSKVITKPATRASNPVPISKSNITNGPATRSRTQRPTISEKKQPAPKKTSTKPINTTKTTAATKTMTTTETISTTRAASSKHAPKPAPAQPVSSGRVTRSRSTASITKSPRRSTRSQSNNASDTSKPDTNTRTRSTNKVILNADAQPATRNMTTTRVTRASKKADSDSGSDRDSALSDNEVFSCDKGGYGSDKQIKPTLESVAEVEMKDSDRITASDMDDPAPDVSRVEEAISDPEVATSAVDTSTTSVAETVAPPVESTSIKYAHINFNTVSAKRGGDFSFAPNDFSFKPPENLDRLSFIPLSPASTAEFMFCGAQSNSSPAFRQFKIPTCTPSSRKKTPVNKNLRNSLLLRKLSPEEKDEVILHSPMVETKRRTPSGKKPTVEPLPTFDDIDDLSMPKMDMFAMAEAGRDMDSNTKLTSSPERLGCIEEEEELISDTSVRGQLTATDNSSGESRAESDEPMDTDEGSVVTDHVEMEDATIQPESQNAVVVDEPSPIPDTQSELPANCSSETNMALKVIEKPEPQDNPVPMAQEMAQDSAPQEEKVLQKTVPLSEQLVQDSVTPTAKIDTESTPQTRDIIPHAEKMVEVPHDVPYFRNLIISETDHLNSLCDKWTAINATAEGISDEVEGEIRTTVGQGHLLMRQRFKQFSGLVDHCEFNTGEKETTCTDLQGFWDMIFFQVEDVDAKFDQLTKLQSNNWITDETKVQKKRLLKKKTVSAKSPKPYGEAKSKFASFRAKLNQEATPEPVADESSNTVTEKPQQVAVSTVCIPEAATEQTQAVTDETKTFHAGFFSISSPVSSPKFHCEAGTPNKASGKRRINSSPLLKVIQRQSLNLSTGASPRLLPLTPLLTKSNNPSPLMSDSTPVKPLVETPVKPQDSCQSNSTDNTDVQDKLELSVAAGVISDCVSHKATSSFTNTPQSGYRTRSGACTPAAMLRRKSAIKAGILSPLVKRHTPRAAILDSSPMQFDEDLCLPLTNIPPALINQRSSLFTPEETSTPSPKRQKMSTRRSLRLMSMSNTSLNLIGTSASTGDDLFGEDTFSKYLQPIIDKENSGPQHPSRRRSMSLPSESTEGLIPSAHISDLNFKDVDCKPMTNSFLFTPPQKMATPVRPIKETEDEPTPTISLMSFSPTVQLM